MYFKIRTKCAGVTKCLLVWQIYALQLHFFLQEHSVTILFSNKKVNKFQGLLLVWLSDNVYDNWLLFWQFSTNCAANPCRICLRTFAILATPHNCYKKTLMPDNQRPKDVKKPV
jgi:hypothetical protein